MNKKLYHIDKEITAWLKHWGYYFLKYSLALVFIWFGILKPFGLGGANDLVAKTVYFVDSSWFVPLLGWWEVAIGICILYRPFVRVGLFLMAFQMIGTFLPLILLPKVIYIKFPFVMTLEGQYIIKNLILIGAGMIVGSHVRDREKKHNV
ncbi:hypothetical protein FJZ21_00340 [Candidatus Pacearchaeota archaeon]|nr:hypothetical protein [Candidatus Pacearchaeota archaeon]